MRMTIDRMTIQNFKGVRELVVDFGTTTKIFGMNGTGKSTIPDAFCWVLFNKDSHGNAPGSDSFHEKPLDVDGKEIHNLDTTVELICRLDGQPFNLRRTQRESWVKKRGASEAVFQGNVSTYWINDVETKLQDFKARIATITSEEAFRLIGSLSAFNQMEWKKRRQQLLALSGEDVDGMLLSRDEYRPLADEIAQRNISPDDLRKVLVDQRKRSNDELKMIPVRIDEANKALPTIGQREISDAEYIVNDTLKDIEKIDGYIADARAQGGVNVSRQQTLALESELVSLKRRVMDEHMAQKRDLQKKADQASEEFRRASAALSTAKTALAGYEERLSKASAYRDKLRADFLDIKQNPIVVETTCPTCGQSLLEDAVQAARDAAERAKRELMESVREKGKAASAEVQNLSESANTSRADIEKYAEKASAAMTERDAAFEAVKAFQDEPDFSTEPRIAEVERELDELRNQATASPDEKIRSYENRKRELQAIIDRNKAVLARRDAAEETKKRIAILEDKQQELGARVTEIERLIALAEKFVQDRCSMLENTINERFPTVRWKLFDVQINGGIVDCCMCMIPCDSGLVSYECANTAAQINADMEIINVLSRHYDLQLPLFVDNSERVNVLAHTDSQLITLSVSTDSELRIEQKEAI